VPKYFFTLITLCAAAIALPGAPQSDQSVQAWAHQEPSPAAMPMPIPIVRPDIHPRIHVHVQQPVIDINRDARDYDSDHDDFEFDSDHDNQMDHDVDVDVDHDDMDLDADHGAPDFDFDFDSDHDDPDLNVHAEEKVQKSFPMLAGHRTLEIDNVWGSIEVVGTSSNEAQLTVNKTYRAESKEKLEEARKRVALDITDQPDSLKLYVNGPFRCNCNDGCGHREFEGYIVKMDFQLQVPRDTDIKIKTVNEGRVSVRDIHGAFLVRNVNGDIQMHNIAGSGTAHTVNGPVKVSFRQNPTEASDFQTVNGAVELQFAKDLAADFRFKTMNGAIYSDFPATALPVSRMQQEHHGAKVIFRADRYTGARIGSGGPQIKVENLNGDIRILENHE